MNPVLLKSGGRRENDGTYLCSVHVLGKQIAVEDYGSLGKRTHTFMDMVVSTVSKLQHITNADMVVLEGAGSCTEMNLMDRDIVNIPLVRKVSETIIGICIHVYMKIPRFRLIQIMTF